MGNQRLAHEHRVKACTDKRPNILRPTNSRLGHPDDRFGERASDTCRPIAVHLEGHQVSLVHANDVSTDSQCAFGLSLVVNLDQDVQPDLDSQRMEIGKLAVIERGDDQENAIRPHEPGIDDVVGGHGEVLAKYRQRNRRSNDFEVLNRSTEIVGIGQH